MVDRFSIIQVYQLFFHVHEKQMFVSLKISFEKCFVNIQELVVVVVLEKLNELARNDSDLDEETDIDDLINCTEDEFINRNNPKRVLLDLLSNQSIHLLDQSQSHKV